MAKLELNALVAALHGTIGDLVLVREGDQIYVRRRARKKLLRTGPKIAQAERLAIASRWARTFLADPAVKAAYQRACHGHLTAHNVAINEKAVTNEYIPIRTTCAWRSVGAVAF